MHWSRQEASSSQNIPVDVDSRPSTPDDSSVKSITEVEAPAPASKSKISVRSLPAVRPSIPRKRPASEHWSKQQSSRPPGNAPSPALNLSKSQPLPEEHANNKDEVIIVSNESPKWYLRSRSPSPKLPSAPLKRRKLSDDPSTPSPKADIIVLERTPSPKARSSIPLPGRTPASARKPHTPVRALKEEKTGPSPAVKQERRSPTPVEALKPERKLITESVQYYPMPESCRKVNPDFAQCRKAYFQEKAKELFRLGLRKTKAFWRYVSFR